jgi:hypothetical protein
MYLFEELKRKVGEIHGISCCLICPRGDRTDSEGHVDSRGERAGVVMIFLSLVDLHSMGFNF